MDLVGLYSIANISAYPLDPLSARGPRREGIAEVLSLTGNLAVSKLHDTHRVRRRTVVCKNEFADPKVARTEYAPHCKALLVRLRSTRRLNIAPAADPLAGLRILEHGIVVINLVLGLEIIGVRGGPVAIQSRANVLVFIHCLLSGGGFVTPGSDRVACGRTKAPSLIREAAFASLQAPVRLVRAPVDPTDAREERQASDRRRIPLYDSRKTNARPARNW